MKKEFGFHHLIFVLFPILLIYLDNINEIPIQDIFVPLTFSLGIILIPWILLTYFIGERKSSIIISLVIIIFIIFAYVRSILIYHEIEEIRFVAKNIILIPIFSIPAVFIIYKIVRQKISSNITQIINVMSIAIFSFMIFQIGLFYSVEPSYDESQILLDVPVFEINEINYTPNVYFLMLDAYSGDITLKKDFGFDNSEFYQQLEKRGFFIQKESYSNYPNTDFSMPSIMNMNYLDFILEIQAEESADLRLVKELWSNNKVMQVFQSAGYEIYSFHGGYDGTSSLITENFCRTNLNLNPELTYSLVNYYIPISEIRVNLFEKQHFDNVLCVLDKTKNFESKTDIPFYMHMHLKLPHQPLVFDSEGNKVKDVISSNRFDSELKDAYLEQVIFANKKTLEIIDEIQNRNSDNVIILMSDHGGRFGVDWNNPSEMDYFRGFNNLSALYFPGQESNLPTYVSAVNTFRVFFNIYFNTDYEILNEKFIWYSPDNPFVQSDVTELVKSSDLRN